MTISRFTPDKPQHDRFITTGFFALSALTGFVARLAQREEKWNKRRLTGGSD
jgi:hypothetical protein